MALQKSLCAILARKHEDENEYIVRTAGEVLAQRDLLLISLLGRCLVELSGIEPLAFPACRDALLAIRLRLFDQFLNRTV